MRMLRFALPLMRMQKLALPPMPTPNVSRWNIGGVLGPHLQHEHNFLWNMGLSVLQFIPNFGSSNLPPPPPLYSGD